MKIDVLESLNQVKASEWNSLVDRNNPFIRHEFLYALESTACCSKSTGWQSKHLVVRDNKNSLVAAMPCYLKDHSYGEYIFDWAWANAFHQNGVDYYPKLSNAVPFTPATGQRLLLSEQLNDTEKTQVTSLINDAINTLLEETQSSSFHSLFIDQSQTDLFTEPDYFIRENTQYHWHNQGYADFDAFLAKLNSKKRKNIKRERRRVQEMEVEYQWHSGEDLSEDIMHEMYRFYLRTIRWYGAQAYLSEDFFIQMARTFSSQTLVLFASFKDQRIAGGLFFKGNDTLYGRYWGALDNFHSIHFETCYYQAIQWCIENGYQRFEAGAQGEHKVARGLLPQTVYSAHKIVHPQFHQMLAKHSRGESLYNAQYRQQINQHSPYRNEL